MIRQAFTSLATHARALPATLRAAAPRLKDWAWRRAQERSTYIGLAAVAGAAGKRGLADHISASADAIVFVLVLAGSGLAAATTSKHPEERP